MYSRNGHIFVSNCKHNRTAKCKYMILQQQRYHYGLCTSSSSCRSPASPLRAVCTPPSDASGQRVSNEMLAFGPLLSHGVANSVNCLHAAGAHAPGTIENHFEAAILHLWVGKAQQHAARHAMMQLAGLAVGSHSICATAAIAFTLLSFRLLDKSADKSGRLKQRRGDSL